MASPARDLAAGVIVDDWLGVARALLVEGVEAFAFDAPQGTDIESAEGQGLLLEILQKMVGEEEWPEEHPLRLLFAELIREGLK